MRPPLPEAPTISVVIRNHNYGPHLGEAVASAWRQSRPPDEVVVVDDGSTDTSAAVIEQLEDEGLLSVVVRRSPSRGPAASFNDGVSASAGDLILALDADDRLSEKYLELTEWALIHADADFAYGGEHRFGAETLWRDAPPFDPDELGVENMLHVSALFRRWVFDETGGFCAALDRWGLEDWEFWVGAVGRGAVGVAVDRCWLDYRRHDTGSRNTISHLDALRAHLLVHHRHPRVVGWSHLARWSARSAGRNLRRMAGVDRMARSR